MSEKDLIENLMNPDINQYQASHMLAYVIIVITILAEWADNHENQPWRSNEQLEKMRRPYDLDGHIQGMAEYLDGELVKCRVISCGSSGYSRTEIVFNDSVYIHIFHTFDGNAQYLYDYIRMNDTEEGNSYFYFQYKLDGRVINSLKLVQPSPHGDLQSEDLTDVRNRIREKLEHDGIERTDESIARKLGEMRDNINALGAVERNEPAEQLQV